MQWDWSVECGADDPVVVIPWASEDGSIRYIDLRESPGGIAAIPEAAQYPALASALLRCNRSQSPLFTAKCDVWNYPADQFDAEDCAGNAYAHASYIDLVAVDPAAFLSFHASERRVREWSRLAQSISLLDSRCEWTLRPARILSAASPLAADEPLDGYAATLYVWGYGDSAASASVAWSTALLALIEPVLFAQIQP